MRKIRIQKDITVHWRIKTNGEATSLVGRDISVILTDPFGNIEKMPFLVSDTNLISIEWLGATHKFIGQYILSAFEHSENPGGNTAVDVVDFVELVERTSQEGGSDPEGLDTETVSLTSDFTTMSRGLSAYEVAVAHGFIGTEEEWLASLKAQNIKIQYSVDGSEGSWHDTPTSEDFFMHTSVDGGTVWGDAAQFRGYIYKQSIEDVLTGNITSHTHDSKQDVLVSGTNIKTVNGTSVLGEGDIATDNAQWGKITGTLSDQTDLQDALDEKYEKPSGGIPSTDMTQAVQDSLALADTALQQHQSLAEYRKASAQDVIDLAMSDRIGAIEGIVPSEASTTNKLADKEFVNSSIATHTANFKGTLDATADLGLAKPASHTHIATALNGHTFSPAPTNNDYCFVINSDEDSDVIYDKFKYVTASSSWAYEYSLNNSSFTAAQWATINSGVTSTKVAAYDAHLASTENPHSVTKAQVGLGNVDNTADLDKPVSTATQTALDAKPDTEDIPTKTSDLSNDSGFITKVVNDLTNYYLKTETYTQSEVDSLISAITKIEFVVVASLPAASASTMNKIYLVPSASQQSQNVKDEFITLDAGAEAETRYTWEQIGSTSVDLSNYYTKTQTDTLLVAKVTQAATLATATTAMIGTAAVMYTGADDTSASPKLYHNHFYHVVSDGEGGAMWQEVTPSGEYLPQLATFPDATQDSPVYFQYIGSDSAYEKFGFYKKQGGSFVITCSFGTFYSPVEPSVGSYCTLYDDAQCTTENRTYEATSNGAQVLVKNTKTEEQVMANMAGGPYYELEDKYVKKSGDTMTGALVAKDGDNSIVAPNNESYIQVCGGPNYGNGAYIILKGRLANYDGGSFKIVAKGANSPELIGRPDKTLKWRGLSLPTISYGTNAPSDPVEGDLWVSGERTDTDVYSKTEADAKFVQIGKPDIGWTKLTNGTGVTGDILFACKNNICFVTGNGVGIPMTSTGAMLAIATGIPSGYSPTTEVKGVVAYNIGKNLTNICWANTSNSIWVWTMVDIPTGAGRLFISWPIF